MTDPTPTAERDRQAAALREAEERGPWATLALHLRLGGPGWIQSAITLGGGSLASCLYLGAISGTGLLWLQPLAMGLGVVMLAAVGFVTLVSGESPFRALRDRVSPFLAYAWALGSLAASIIWAMPQFSLATGVLQQNLWPSLLGEGGPWPPGLTKVGIVLVLALVTGLWTRTFGRPQGVRWYEGLLKVLVGAIVLAFVGVAARLLLHPDGPSFSDLWRGFVPHPEGWSEPPPAHRPFLDAMDPEARAFWRAHVLGLQRDVLISAAATAVGINMTFLLPCTLRARGWNGAFVRFLRFDLATGLLVPFTLATSCIVVASAHGFHGRPVPGLLGEGPTPSATAVREYDGLVAARFQAIPPPLGSARELPRPERELAARLVRRDAFDLARALEPLAGVHFAHTLFGFGVLGMALSTVTVQMLIAGFVVAELSGAEPGPRYERARRRGSALVLLGVAGPFVWNEASFYLAVPASLFGMTLLPIAYGSFVGMMNSERLLGAARPRGLNRWLWNGAMLPAAGLAAGASLLTLWSRAGVGGLLLAGACVAATVVWRPKGERSVVG